MVKQNLILYWNTSKRNNLEYSELAYENISELNSRKDRYSFKIYIDKEINLLVGWDRLIKQHDILNPNDKVYYSLPSNEVLRLQSKDIEYLKQVAQTFINEKFR